MTVEVLEGLRVRVLIDGSFVVPRVKKELRARLDQFFTRVDNTDDRWYLKFYLEHTDFADQFAGKVCYIIGKGPSLDNLSLDDFPESDAPIIAINEAIHKVESLGLPNPTFMMQQDTYVGEDALPIDATVLLECKAVGLYHDYEKLQMFCWHELGVNHRNCTAALAAAFAQKFNAERLVMLCLDACAKGTLGYAGCIGKNPESYGPGDRFLKHRKMIESSTTLPIEWITPTYRVASTSYIPSPLPDNLEEHHESALL